MDYSRFPKHKIAAILLTVAVLLIYRGLYIGIDIDEMFDGGGYSYLYYDDMNTIKTFVIPNSFNDEQNKDLSVYLQQVNLQPNDSTEEKIIKLSKFILDRIDDTRGVPDKSWYKKSPYEQFKIIWNKELSGGIYCTQFRLVYTLLANEAGIPTRVVHSAVTRSPRSNKVQEGKGVSRHNFSESYIRETGQWAHVDLNQRVILTKDSDGNYLNTVDLYDYYMGYRQGDNIVLTTYESMGKVIHNEYFESRAYFVNYLADRTAYRLFFQKNQLFYYDRKDRSDFRFRPYLVSNRVGLRSYVLGGGGILLSIAVCIYFIWPFLLKRYRHRINRTQN